MKVDCLWCNYHVGSIKRIGELAGKAVDELEAENACLREALAFYAEKRHIERKTYSHVPERPSEWPMQRQTLVNIEDGDVARDALEEKKS